MVPWVDRAATISTIWGGPGPALRYPLRHAERRNDRLPLMADEASSHDTHAEPVLRAHVPLRLETVPRTVSGRA